MKSYRKNPRQITEKQYKDLEKWLLELGDLSGIVHDLNSDEIVAGNQRGRVFDVNQCEIVKVQEFDEPDEQGTVALGYVVWEGNRYGYRAVRWTERQCEQANIVANRAGGSWAFDILGNQFEIPDLLDWGFTEFDLQINDVAPMDYSDFEKQLEELDGYEENSIAITVPEMHRERVIEWLANGEVKTSPGMGKGVMRRCGLLS